MLLRIKFILILLFVLLLPLPSLGAAFIYDGMVKEPRGSGIRQIAQTAVWQNRANWYQVPYGTTSYTFTGDPIIGNENFIIHFSNSYMDAPFIYPNISNGWTSSAGTGYGQGNELYGYNKLDGKTWFNAYPHNLTILENTANEIIFSADMGANSFNVTTGVVSYSYGKNIIQYRIKSGLGWVEQKPLTTGQYMFGIHSGNRGFAVSPSPNDNNADFVIEGATKPTGFYSMPTANKYIMQDTDMVYKEWAINMVIPAHPLTSGTNIRTSDSYRNGVLYYHGIWELMNDYTYQNGTSNNATYVGVVNRQNTYRWEPITTAWLTSGGSYTTTNTMPIAGKWRISGNVGGTYYTQTRDVSAGEKLTFTSPVPGTLRNVSYYLYDRNDETPSDVNTPQDIYNSIFTTYNETTVDEPEPDTADNYLRKPVPTGIYNNASYPFLAFGCNAATCSTQLYRSVIKLNLSGVTGNTLRLYDYGFSPANRTNISRIEIYKTAKEWQTNYTSWNNYGNSLAWSNAGGDWVDANNVSQGGTPYAYYDIPTGTRTEGYIDFDISQLISEENAAGHTNASMLIKLNTTNESQAWNYMAVRGLDYGDQSQIPYIYDGDVVLYAPALTSWNNNKTNDVMLEVTGLTRNTSIRFNVTANQTVNYSWYRDGVLENNNYDNYTTNWSVAGNYTVGIIVSNANGSSDMMEWTIEVTPPLIPNAPTNLAIDNSTNYWTNVSWDVDNSGNYTDYSIVNFYFSSPFDTNISYHGLHITTGDTFDMDMRVYQAWSLDVTVSSYNVTGGESSEISNSSTVPVFNHTTGITTNYFNFTGTVGTNYTVKIRALNTTYNEYSTWAEDTVSLEAESVIEAFTRAIYDWWES